MSVLTRREEHARALSEEGLRVRGRADFLARVDAPRPTPAALPEPDLVIVACKGTDVDAGRGRGSPGIWPDAT